MEGMERHLSVNDAMMEIHAIQTRIMQGGSVDEEPNKLAKILEELETKKISPRDAIKKAQELESGRQDYH